MMYMGSTVVYGRGKAVVTDTGMNTEMGKIANALTLAEEGKTPLQIKLTQLSKALTWIVLGICLFIFAFNIMKAGDFHFEPILNSFMVAVSLAVASDSGRPGQPLSRLYFPSALQKCRSKMRLSGN